MASLEKIRNERLGKLDLLLKNGVNPFPLETKRSHPLSVVRADFESFKKDELLTLAGRVMSIRGQGGILFVSIADDSDVFQGLFKRENVKTVLGAQKKMEEDPFELFKKAVDVGDFIKITGGLMTTKRGEKSLEVDAWGMLSKSLRPLPEKWHGLQDVEEKYRRRYLDTLMSEETRERFVLRSQIIRELRTFLEYAGFMEVETPILQTLAGGATAKPFKTHYEALDIDVELRVAVELFHKRLLVGGFTKIYEISKNFRNEGIDATHSPEFTMLEYYEAYSTGEDQQAFVEAMIRSLVKNIFGEKKIEIGEVEYDFEKPFRRVTFFDLLKHHSGIDDPESLDKGEAVLRAKELGISLLGNEELEDVVDKIYKKTCRPKLIQPTFIVDYPVAFSPFAKRREGSEGFIDRFQLVVGGYELVNAFSELNDPLEQRERYKKQEEKRGKGGEDISPSDEDYLEAMEYGMPPAGGVGIGIDRLVMLLCGAENIRDVILFPTLRPKK